MAGASSEYDDIRMQETLEGPSEQLWTAENKHVVEINDTQQGNYSGGQISFNLSSIASSKSYTDMKGSTLDIPITMTMTIPAGNNGVTFPLYPEGGVTEASNRIYAAQLQCNRLAMSLKNSSLSLISGIEVWCNGKQVIPLQQFSSLPLNWGLMKEWSEDDQLAFGPSMNFFKDTSASVVYDNLLGELNNNVYPTTPSSWTTGTPNPDAPVNAGRVHRMKEAARIRPPTYASDTEASLTRQPTFTISEDGRTMKWTQFHKIHLRYLNKFFENAPLMKAGLWTMNVHTHIPTTHEMSYELRRTADVIRTVPVGVAGYMINQYCPYIVSPVGYAVDNAAPAAVGAANGPTGCNVTRRGGIADGENYPFKIISNIKIGIDGPSGSNSTTLKMAQIELSTEAENKIIRAPKKEVIWTDFSRTQPEGLLEVGPTFKTVRVVENAIRIRGLLLFPYASAGNNGALMAGSALSSLMSPFTTAGNTAAPFVTYTQLQTSCSGIPIWDRPYRHTSDLWQREQYGIGSPNGNSVDGFRTGLINEIEFSEAYTQTWINLARHEQTQDHLPAGVQIEMALNIPNARRVAYHVFHFVEKRMQIDSITGDVFPLP